MQSWGHTSISLSDGELLLEGSNTSLLAKTLLSSSKVGPVNRLSSVFLRNSISADNLCTFSLVDGSIS